MPIDVKWPFPPANQIPRAWNTTNKAVMAAAGMLCKLWIEYLNRITVHNKKVLYSALDDRPRDQPLLTVSNHHSCLDDPLLWGVLHLRHLVYNNTSVMRWTLGAADVCFTKQWHSRFFSFGRIVPVCRGEGVYQSSMEFILDKLNAGGWVHTFPEGRINSKHEFIRLKWGVGRLIADCRVAPLVIPMWHVGFDDILPNYRPYIPRIGKRVTVLIGQPMEFTSLIKELQQKKASPLVVRKAITDQIQQELYVLKDKVEQLHITSTKPVT